MRNVSYKQLVHNAAHLSEMSPVMFCSVPYFFRNPAEQQPHRISFFLGNLRGDNDSDFTDTPCHIIYPFSGRSEFYPLCQIFRIQGAYRIQAELSGRQQFFQRRADLPAVIDIMTDKFLGCPFVRRFPQRFVSDQIMRRQIFKTIGDNAPFFFSIITTSRNCCFKDISFSSSTKYEEPVK